MGHRVEWQPRPNCWSNLWRRDHPSTLRREWHSTHGLWIPVVTEERLRVRGPTAQNLRREPERLANNTGLIRFTNAHTHTFTNRYKAKGGPPRAYEHTRNRRRGRGGEETERRGEEGKPKEPHPRKQADQTRANQARAERSEGDSKEGGGGGGGVRRAAGEAEGRHRGQGGRGTRAARGSCKARPAQQHKPGERQPGRRPASKKEQSRGGREAGERPVARSD